MSFQVSLATCLAIAKDLPQQQILRSSTPATAKAAVAGDPGFAQDDTSINR
jgi:hypothetical protein